MVQPSPPWNVVLAGLHRSCREPGGEAQATPGQVEPALALRRPRASVRFRTRSDRSRPQDPPSATVSHDPAEPRPSRGKQRSEGVRRGDRTPSLPRDGRVARNPDARKYGSPGPAQARVTCPASRSVGAAHAPRQRAAGCSPVIASGPEQGEASSDHSIHDRQDGDIIARDGHHQAEEQGEVHHR